MERSIAGTGALNDRKRLAMNSDLLLVLGALIACVGLFIVNKPRMDVVALLVIVVLPLTGIISMPEALAGFSDTNVVLIAALFVIGEGLTRTGIAYRLSDHLIGMSGTSGARLLVLLMLAVAGLGSVMSSTGSSRSSFRWPSIWPSGCACFPDD